MTLQPIWITDDAPAHAFPDVDNAMIQPNGLLAVGGDLSPARLLHAYQRGIFPWFSVGQPYSFLETIDFCGSTNPGAGKSSG